MAMPTSAAAAKRSWSRALPRNSHEALSLAPGRRAFPAGASAHRLRRGLRRPREQEQSVACRRRLLAFVAGNGVGLGGGCARPPGAEDSAARPSRLGNAGRSQDLRLLDRWAVHGLIG